MSQQQIRALEQACFQSGQVQPLQLMEAAAYACSTHICSLLQGRNLTQPVVVVCGSGNNGGDGYAIARHLWNRGYMVTVLQVSPPQSDCCQINYEQSKSFSVPIVKEFNHWHATVVIDCIFGIGFHPEVSTREAEIIRGMNTSFLCISIDIPSGIVCDRGITATTHVKAHHTLALHCLKPCHILPPTAPHCGEVTCLPIGLPESSTHAQVHSMRLPRLFKRNPYSHKGTFGHVLCIGGSLGMVGALHFSAKAAFVCGAGKVSALVPAPCIQPLQTLDPEIMCLSHETDTLNPEVWQTFHSFVPETICLGPGLGRGLEQQQLVKHLLHEDRCAMIVDADALFAMGQDRDEILDLCLARQNPLLLTPHPQEMARLVGIPTEAVLQDALNVAKTYAMTHGAYVVLKGFHVILAEPDGRLSVFCQPNAGLAKGGMGDVLAGILSGLMAQGMGAGDACFEGLHLYMSAADLMTSEVSSYCGSPLRLIESLPKIFQMLEKS